LTTIKNTPPCVLFLALLPLFRNVVKHARSFVFNVLYQIHPNTFQATGPTAQENHLHTHNFITHLSLAHLKSSVRFTFISLLKQQSNGPATVDDLRVKNQSNEQSMFPTHSITQHEAHIRKKDLFLYPGRRHQTKKKLRRETEKKMGMALFASAKKKIGKTQ